LPGPPRGYSRDYSRGWVQQQGLKKKKTEAEREAKKAEREAKNTGTRSGSAYILGSLAVGPAEHQAASAFCVCQRCYTARVPVLLELLCAKDAAVPFGGACPTIALSPSRPKAQQKSTSNGAHPF
jgi:hypothetical protein